MNLFEPVRKEKNSRNGSPIDIGFTQVFQLNPQDGILGIGFGWIAINHSLCYLTHKLKELTVTGNVGYFQIEGNAALLGSFEIAGTTQLQIGFGYLKPSVELTMISIRLRVSSLSL